MTPLKGALLAAAVLASALSLGSNTVPAGPLPTAKQLTPQQRWVQLSTGDALRCDVVLHAVRMDKTALHVEAKDSGNATLYATRTMAEALSIFNGCIGGSP